MTTPNDRQHEEAERKELIALEELAHKCRENAMLATARYEDELRRQLSILRDSASRTSPDYLKCRLCGSTSENVGMVGGIMRLLEMGWRAVNQRVEYECPSCAKETDSASRTEGEKEQMYPCQKCGKLRTKAEGGTTFTVCEACWYEKKLQPEDRGGKDFGWAVCDAYGGQMYRVTDEPDLKDYKPGWQKFRLTASDSKGHDKAAGQSAEKPAIPVVVEKTGSAAPFSDAEVEEAWPKQVPREKYEAAKTKLLRALPCCHGEGTCNATGHFDFAYLLYAVEEMVNEARSRPAPAAKGDAEELARLIDDEAGIHAPIHGRFARVAIDWIRSQNWYVRAQSSAKGEAVREKIIRLIAEAREYARNTGGHSPAMIFADEVEAALMKGDAEEAGP